MSEWQPIETAPYDDPEAPHTMMLLLWEPHEMGGFAFVGARDGGTNVFYNNLDQQTQYPTHWMPLPKAPD